MDAEALREQVIGKYTDYINPGLARLMGFAGFGVETRAEGCYLWDQDGKQYLDCLGGYGVFALGHRHPKIIEAVKSQLDVMPLSGKTFFNAKQADLAEKLAHISPEGLQFSFFSNSGAEAVEAALKFAKMATRRAKIVSTEGSYHGKTLGALATTGRAKYRKPFEPLMPGVEFVPFGQTSSIVEAIDSQTAAVIVEVIQGEGGVHVAPDGYLQAIRERCDAVGALMIADEVQTGMGRTGKMFACEHDGVSPDIMTLAKALGGGAIPIGCTMGNAQVWESVFSENPLIHTSTFGGNPLACAAGLAAIDVIESEGLVDRCKETGEFLKAAINDLVAEHDIVSNVRGKGLLIGVEFALDDVGELVTAQLVKRGLIAAYTLNNPRVIRIEPPLIITRAQAEWAAETLKDAVIETAELLASIA